MNAKNSKKLPTLLPLVLEFRVMYLSFSDQFTGKELQSVLGYPSLRHAPFILLTAVFGIFLEFLRNFFCL